MTVPPSSVVHKYCMWPSQIHIQTQKGDTTFPAKKGQRISSCWKKRTMDLNFSMESWALLSTILVLLYLWVMAWTPLLCIPVIWMILRSLFPVGKQKALSNGNSYLLPEMIKQQKQTNKTCYKQNHLSHRTFLNSCLTASVLRLKTRVKWLFSYFSLFSVVSL